MIKSITSWFFQEGQGRKFKGWMAETALLVKKRIDIASLMAHNRLAFPA